MTEINNLTHIIQNNINPIFNQQTELNYKSINLISLLFNRIAYANELWLINKKYINRIITQFTHSNNINYYPDYIQNYIQNTKIKNNYTYSFIIGERNITINLITYNNENIQTIIKNIYIWLTIVNFYSTNEECSQNINIYLYLTNNNKYLPENNNLINREHCNTAYTYACKKNNEIHIFRKEEWFKVFIHETFHSFGLDYSYLDNNNIDNNLRTLFNIEKKLDIRSYEAYCEVWAEIINIMFIVFHNTKWHDNSSLWFNKLFQKFNKMITNDIQFSFFQSVKIMEKYNLNYNNLCSQNKTKYNENTHIFSYYFLKTILYFNINEFLNWCFDNNNKSIEFNSDRIINFYKLFENLYNNDEIKSNFDNILNYYRDNKKNMDSNVIKTLRMSLYELQ